MSLSTSDQNQGEFEHYVRTLYQELLNFARKMAGGDKQKALDVVQESMLKMYRAWPKFKPREDLHYDQAVRAWMFRIVSNTYLKAYKAERRRCEVYPDSSPASSDPSWDIACPDPRDDHERETCDEVLEAVARLAPNHRTVIELFYFDNLTNEEIAVKLGLPMNTVFTRLHRARAILQKRLGVFVGRERGLEARPARTRSAPMEQAAA